MNVLRRAPLLVALVVAAAACTPARIETEVRGAALGTTYSVKVVAPGAVGGTAKKALRQRIERTIDAVDRSMSTYRADSELSRINASASLEPISISEELFSLLETSLELGRLSRGAFDVTVGPLVNAWGFGPTPAEHLPDDSEIAALLERVGQDKLILDPETRSLTRLRSDLYIDLSAIAKGLAVDRVAEAIDELGYREHLVEIGGEVRARGANRQGEPWRVAIERPPDAKARAIGELPLRAAQRVVPLRDQSLATSGDYRNYIEVDGQRYSHEIDPHSGRPVRHRATSVSVLHPSATYADGWATALLVLGPELGLALATERNLAALFLVYNDEASIEGSQRADPQTEELQIEELQIEELPSPAFEAYLAASSHGPDGNDPHPTLSP